MRRADRLDLHSAAVKDVEKSYAALFHDGGFEIAPGILHEAAVVTEGYPFLIQLVGYFLWREAELNPVMTEEAAAQAFAAARRRNARMVVEAAMSTLSGRDLDFLRAMAEDDESSTAKDIGQRMGVASSMVGNHRARLIAAGLIEPVRQGVVRFALPGLREHLLGL